MCWNDLSKYRSQLYGLAIIWIIFFHIHESFYDKLNFHYISSVIFNNGNLGVDIFLFLSGVSMHYSMKKYKELNYANIVDFYRRRFGKILKVYFFFCVPFMVLRDLIIGNNTRRFVRQVLFFDKQVSIFWFLLAITICYFIYPFLRILLLKGKKRVIVAIIGIYIVVLLLINHYYNDFYKLYEILLTRIPIFIIGSLWGRKVEEHEEVSLREFSFFMLVVFLKSPIIYAVSRIPAISEIKPVMERLFMGWMGIGIILIMILFIKVYEDSKIDRFICWVGGFTLEIYVFHIALRRTMIFIMSKMGMTFESYRQIMLFGIIFVPFSIAGGYVLFVLMNKLRKR